MTGQRTTAEAAGGDWPNLAANAAVELCKGDDDQESIVTLVLAAVKEIFANAGQNRKDGFLASSTILLGLNSDNEARWSGWRNGMGISAEKLSSLLRPFGVKSEQTTTTPQVRGYYYKKLKPVFDRYL